MRFAFEEARSYLASQLESYLTVFHGINTNRRFQCFHAELHKNFDQDPSMGVFHAAHLCHCFACGASMNLFDLIQQDYGLSSPHEAWKKACEIYDVEVITRPGSRKEGVKRLERMAGKEFGSGSFFPMSASIDGGNLPSGGAGRDFTLRSPGFSSGPGAPGLVCKEWEQGKDLTRFFEDAVRTRRVSPRALSYLHGRGLSDGILDRFQVGYVKSWRHPLTYNPRTERIIVPNSRNSYLARVLNDTEALGLYDHKKMKVGRQSLFNEEAVQPGRVVFVVEGEFDAMSIEEMGFFSVGLGSTSQYRKLADLVKKRRERVEGTVFVISLDRDSAGDEMGRRLTDLLLEGGASAERCEALSGDFKDPNERLQHDPEGLRRDLGKVAGEAEKIRRAA